MVGRTRNPIGLVLPAAVRGVHLGPPTTASDLCEFESASWQ